MCYHYFWVMSANHIEFYQLIPEEKRMVVGLELNQVLTLKFQFSNLFSIIICMFVQGYLKIK